MKGILSLTSDMKLWQQKCRERHVYYETPQFCYIAILEDSAGTISMQTCWCFSGAYLEGYSCNFKHFKCLHVHPK